MLIDPLRECVVALHEGEVQQLPGLVPHVREVDRHGLPESVHGVTAGAPQPIVELDALAQQRHVRVDLLEIAVALQARGLDQRTPQERLLPMRDLAVGGAHLRRQSLPPVTDRAAKLLGGMPRQVVPGMRRKRLLGKRELRLVDRHVAGGAPIDPAERFDLDLLDPAGQTASLIPVQGFHEASLVHRPFLRGVEADGNQEQHHEPRRQRDKRHTFHGKVNGFTLNIEIKCWETDNVFDPTQQPQRDFSQDAEHHQE